MRLRMDCPETVLPTVKNGYRGQSQKKCDIMAYDKILPLQMKQLEKSVPLKLNLIFVNIIAGYSNN